MAAREPTCRQWRPRVEKTRRHCSSVQKPSITVLAVAKVSLQFLDCLGFIL
jgi:hypothetical protein